MVPTNGAGPESAVTDIEARKVVPAGELDGQADKITYPRVQGGRQRLDDRRAADVRELAHANQRYRLHVGRFPSGALAEVFVDSSKPNSTMDAFAADAAILISLLLQHGATPNEIGHALRRNPNGAAASLIGAVVDALQVIETEVRHD
jgi:hypothetical protein